MPKVSIFPSDNIYLDKPIKPIFVHVHLYYPQLWNELKLSLLNLCDYPHEIYITMTNNNIEIIKNIHLNFPEAEIEIIENRGYDVGPFLHILNKINLDKYSYVIKLHSKKNMPNNSYLNGFNLSLNKWRLYALKFMKPENLELCLHAFDDNQKLGMISDFRLIQHNEIYNKKNFQFSKNLLEELRLPIGPFCFVAGTMFICRAKLLHPLSNLNFTLRSFNFSEKSCEATLAHNLERFIGWSITSQGYQIKDVYSTYPEIFTTYFIRFFYYLKRFIYQYKITKSGKKCLKICKIPLGFLLNFGDGK